ncbi:TetR/AcrR family transcriptional regulator [Streptosporangium lutulentum]|uniref:AcrR family transcriptional regulator n=1 Tax=Streptosporangium lutulentum TaxID=1461250 RepID=A0ABT9Q962_9ACTN|nr:TetR/AcrR family transcriptional regulator [Streptosporangium lutulentum]MDP9842931.1 AcrR family transcriptional regulator [Streptosporangium lutulentum]
MGRSSDSRQRMVAAARQLIRERGYHGTALSDVVKRSAAPRGSVYHHFPEGKVQMAAEAADSHAREQVEMINQVAGSSSSAEDLVRTYFDLAREGMVNSGYQRGCAIAPLVIEASEESEGLDEVGRRSFSSMVDGMAFQLTVLGVEHTAARELAHAVVAAVEGALVTSRALRSPEPFDAVRVILADRARNLTAHLQASS